MVYSVKMINAPMVPTIGSTGYQMYQTVDGEGADVPSRYGPIIVSNNFADLFFEKQSLKCWAVQKLNRPLKCIKQQR